ncbi:SDR family NAD(P)-dependent oxidoreductase, partial [Shigella sonnei]|nr:SDR family NAD(P)-dependent oxidoreductase [Shigella sonnei]
AQKLLQEGHNVVITGRDLERLNGVKDEFSSIGEIDSFQMDVRDPEHAKAMVAFTVERFGSVDGLVNNAAGNFLVAAEKLSPNGWKAVIDIV